MNLEVKVRQPKCTFCPYLHRHDASFGMKLKGVYLRPFSRYCTGGKRPKVFKAQDPKEKVPTWCPRSSRHVSYASTIIRVRIRNFSNACLSKED